MGFLRKLFGNRGHSGSSYDKWGLYFYVRPKHCQEVVKVRVNTMNDLSLTDDESGYFVRKVVQATRCPFPAELHLYFSKSKNLTRSDVTDGELVSEAEYEAWLAEKEAGKAEMS
ncbi:MAG: hypothetical protein Kow00117_03620 [Phototrophicales bacterium]